MRPGAIAQSAQVRRSRRRQDRGISRFGAQVAMKSSRGPWPGQRPPTIHSRTDAGAWCSVRSSTIRDRRGGASQTVSRSRATIDHSENARTGTAAPGPESSRAARALRASREDGLSWRREAAAAAELSVVNLIANHEEEADEELAGYGHAGLGATTAMDQRAVDPVQVVIGAGGQWGGLAEDPAEQRAALLGDLPQVAGVCRGAHGGGQADVAHDVLAPREAGGGAPGQERGGCGVGVPARRGAQGAGAGSGGRRGGQDGV